MAKVGGAVTLVLGLCAVLGGVAAGFRFREAGREFLASAATAAGAVQEPEDPAGPASADRQGAASDTGSPSTRDVAPRVVLTPLFDTAKSLVARRSNELRFRLVDSATREPLPAEDVRVRLSLAPGTWHSLAVPRVLEDGALVVSFTPPEPGQYELAVGTQSPRSPLGTLPPLLLGATHQAARARPQPMPRKALK